MKSLKTPLRYPGGKSRATVKLFQYLPDMSTIKEFREPFLGGGSMAIAMAKQYPNLKIWVNDLYEPLVNFWQVVQSNGKELSEYLLTIKLSHDAPDEKDSSISLEVWDAYNDRVKIFFNQTKENLNDPSRTKLQRAADFFIINKCSFSGLTESSSFSKLASIRNFSVNGINNLVGYSEIIKDWIITNSSYENILTDDKGVFVYLDPPYEIKDSLYGNKGNMHRTFNHDKFAVTCDLYTCPMMVSYNSSNLIKERFKNWQSMEFAHTYTMRSVGSYTTDQAARHELVLVNYNNDTLEQAA